MRIGIFHSTLPENSRKPGGVEVFVHRLSQRLAMRGHHVHVFSFSPPPADAQYQHSRPLGPRTPTKLRRMTTIPWNLNKLDTAGLDILHLHGDDWFFVRRDLPTIRSFYGSALYEARYATRWRRRTSQTVIFGLELLAARLATRSYSVGPGWPRLYRLSGVLDCGVELNEKSQHGRSKAPSLLFVGTWEGRKRGRFLYEVFSREVRTRLPDAELWMVSDEGFSGDGVTWIRRPSDEQLAQLYCRAWAFCLPSTYEGFGIPYIEAMAYGTPVVASPNVGARYVLNGGHTGLIIDDTKLGDALVRILSDAQLRSRLTQAGHTRANDFGWELVLDAHENAYRETLAAGVNRRALTC